MTQNGLSEVTNPSKLLLAGRSHDAIGSCIFAGMRESAHASGNTSFDSPHHLALREDP